MPTKNMFKIDAIEDSDLRVVHRRAAIRIRTSITVVTPASCTWDELRRWVASKAVWNSDTEEWDLEDEEIGQFDSMGDKDIQSLVSEVANWLHEQGVSFDSPAYRY